jgi:hypothetical protein
VLQGDSPFDLGTAQRATVKSVNGGVEISLFFVGFTEGYYLGIMMGQGLEKAQRHICFPQPPNENPPDTTQVELVVKKFLVDHPDRLNEEALFLVQEAFASAFGCQRKSTH